MTDPDGSPDGPTDRLRDRAWPLHILGKPDYFRKLGFPPHEVAKLPANDGAAYRLYPSARFAYDRLKLAEFQGFEAMPSRVDFPPGRFPVIHKPIVNLSGLSLNARVLHNLADFEEVASDCHFWSRFLTGEHLSYDLAVEDGRVVWSVCFLGVYDDANGHLGFTEWCPVDRPLPEIAHRWIAQARGWSGMFNVESIGDPGDPAAFGLIESHPRCGDVAYLPDFAAIENIVGLYNGRGWADRDYRPPRNTTLVPVFLAVEDVRRFLRLLEASHEPFEQALNTVFEDAFRRADPADLRVVKVYSTYTNLMGQKLEDRKKAKVGQLNCIGALDRALRIVALIQQAMRETD